METLTYQHQPENWLYEIKQKGDSQTCYVMVQNAKVCISSTFLIENNFFLSLFCIFFNHLMSNDMKATRK